MSENKNYKISFLYFVIVAYTNMKSLVIQNIGLCYFIIKEGALRYSKLLYQNMTLPTQLSSQFFDHLCSRMVLAGYSVLQ